MAALTPSAGTGVAGSRNANDRGHAAARAMDGDKVAAGCVATSRSCLAITRVRGPPIPTPASYTTCRSPPPRPRRRHSEPRPRTYTSFGGGGVEFVADGLRAIGEPQAHEGSVDVCDDALIDIA